MLTLVNIVIDCEMLHFPDLSIKKGVSPIVTDTPCAKSTPMKKEQPLTLPGSANQSFCQPQLHIQN